MADDNYKHCPVCLSNLSRDVAYEDALERVFFTCVRCCHFMITRTVMFYLGSELPNYQLSAWIRNQNESGNNSIEITTKNYKEILENLPKFTAAQKQHMLLSTIKKRTNHYGEEVTVHLANDGSLVWAENVDEMKFHMQCLCENGFISESKQPKVLREKSTQVILQSAGEEYLDSKSVFENSYLEKQKNFMNTHSDKKKIFVVHGRNMAARNAMFTFLRAIDLQPIEWSEAVRLTGKPTPYVGEILNTAFSNAVAVVVLFTGDDYVKLRDELIVHDDLQHEKEITPQARPNVLFEAGMAYGSHPENTVLVQLGNLKPFSDIGGRHIVRIDNSSQKRQDLAERLKSAGCDVNLNGRDWHTAGDFDKAILFDNNSVQIFSNEIISSEGDILALLDDWWPKPVELIPDDVKVVYSEIDSKLSISPGSTQRYIDQIAQGKSFKRKLGGGSIAIFTYVVDPSFFGTVG